MEQLFGGFWAGVMGGMLLILGIIGLVDGPASGWPADPFWNGLAHVDFALSVVLSLPFLVIGYLRATKR